MFINGDGNWVNILNDAVITYNNNIHSTINMTPAEASNYPDKVRYSFYFKNLNLKLVITLELKINVISFLKVKIGIDFLIGIEKCLKLKKFQKHNRQHIR